MDKPGAGGGGGGGGSWTSYLYTLDSRYIADIYNTIWHRASVTTIQLWPDFAFTNETPYLVLTGELWGVFRNMFKEIRPRYIESAL